MKSVHEPDAQLMNADEVWEDAQVIMRLHQGRTKQVDSAKQVLFANVLSSLDVLDLHELKTLQAQVQERIAVFA